jgi:hypothetical protein
MTGLHEDRPAKRTLHIGMDVRQFLLHGLDAVRGERSLVIMVWNIKRLYVLCPPIEARRRISKGSISDTSIRASIRRQHWRDWRPISRNCVSGSHR